MELLETRSTALIELADKPHHHHRRPIHHCYNGAGYQTDTLKGFLLDVEGAVGPGVVEPAPFHGDDVRKVRAQSGLFGWKRVWPACNFSPAAIPFITVTIITFVTIPV